MRFIMTAITRNKVGKPYKKESSKHFATEKEAHDNLKSLIKDQEREGRVVIFAELNDTHNPKRRQLLFNRR